MKQRGFEILSSYQNKNISLPERKTALSAGYDIAAAEDTVVPQGQVAMIPTGIKAYMQPDEYLGIHIRSSLAVKSKLALINSQGIIDADYYDNPSNEGHILIAVMNFSAEDIRIEKGARIAQGIFYKFLTADQDDKNKMVQNLRTGGFGSTGSL